MEIVGDTLIPAPIQTVWDGLNNADVLRACIPGCEALEQRSPTELTARVVQKIGPVSASFTGEVTLSELNPPHSYRITGQGSGGVAGFAKGGAFVKLSEEEGGTRLRYTVEAQLGGKIAQLGSRMIKGIATSLAGEFFRRFSEEVSGAPAVSVARPVSSTKVSPPSGAVPAGADGPGWRLVAMAGWAAAAGFGLIALVLAMNA